MPKPDERNSRTAARKSGLIKTPAQQSAFAAQNLEDMVMYDVERVRNSLKFPFISLTQIVLFRLIQACQTQTTFRAKKATKTVEGAAKVLKNFLAGYI
jgi:hypothetical protein